MSAKRKPPKKVNITPEMIKAGSNALREYAGTFSAVLSNEIEADLVRVVLDAALAASGVEEARQVSDQPLKLTRDDAIEELAKYLHWKMWHLDPTPGEDRPPTWDALPEPDQQLYRSSVDALLSNTSLIMAAV